MEIGYETFYTRPYKVQRPEESHCFLNNTKQDTSTNCPIKQKTWMNRKSHLAKSWGLHWLQRQKVMGNTNLLWLLEMKYKRTGKIKMHKGGCDVPREVQEKNIWKEEKVKRGKEGRDCKEMIIKIRNTVKRKVNLSAGITENVNESDASLLGKIIWLDS